MSEQNEENNFDEPTEADKELVSFVTDHLTRGQLS